MNRERKIILVAVLVLLLFLFIFAFPKQVDQNSSSFFYSDKKVAELVAVESKTKKETKLLFVGDIMLSRAIGKIMEREDDWEFHFRLVKDFLNDADILFGNLESPITDKGNDLGGVYSFRADPRSILGLSKAGFDVVSFANNHAWDYGEEAFLDTLAQLGKFGISISGAGRNFKEAHKPKIIETNGERIAFLSYTNLLPESLRQENSEPAVASLKKELIEKDIKNIKENNLADIVVVSFHWGDEYETLPNEFQKELGRFAIDAGAGLVIGHHPHVIQPVEEYGGGLIAYSLGNFIFDQNFNELTSKGLILEVNVIDGEIMSFETYEVEFNSLYQPYVL